MEREVEKETEFEVFLLEDVNVARLDVSVHHVFTMKRCHPSSNLPHHPQDPLQSDRRGVWVAENLE